MEYRQNDIYRAAGADMKKVPFYMTYPMQNVFLEEMEYERDMESMKRMYPVEARAVQELVEEECDKLEYEGSMMFDEYPDRLMLRRICGSIYQRLTESGNLEAEQYEDMETEELRMVRPGRPPGRPGPGGPPDRPPFGPPPPPGRPPFGPPPPPGRPPFGPPPPPPGGGLQNLIEVLLYNEMYQRRCRHKRCRRWW